VGILRGMRRTIVIALGVLAAAVLVVGVFTVVAPSGSSSALTAAVAHVRERADRGSAHALVARSWGGGQLVLVGYDRRGARRLGIAFASKQLRGWRVNSYTEESVEPDDVVVGSLIVASSHGGEGQPSWSAAAGELIDSRVARVEVHWASGSRTNGERFDDAYLVVEGGDTNAVAARYLTKDGAEVATVPISAKR
jgi:hypothetical protein